MECGLCQRQPNASRKLLCVSCVQASLYKPRIDQVGALLNHEKSHTHAEAVLRPGNDGVIAALPEDADWDAIKAGISTRRHERANIEKDKAELRIAVISEKVKELQQQIEGHKRYIAEQKQLHQRRRDAIDLERQKLAERKTRTLEPVQAAIKRANRHLDKTHTRTAASREYLCKEVVALCRLQRGKDKKGRSEFSLYGLPIPNLKDINCLNGRISGEKVGRIDGQPLAEPHELISASLHNVCLFLEVCCYYLSIRLPAEIIFPHDDFPHAALMQREASYKAGELRYPGLSSSNSSPVQSRVLSSEGERGKPRILHLRKPLLELQKQDPKTHALFLEGAMLLAYNIAWLCRSQGIVDGTPSFDDVCDIGRNLHTLFGKDTKPALDRRGSTTANKTGTDTSNNISIGFRSHGSAKHSLAGHEGTAMFAPDVWKVSLTSLTDHLKSYLRREAARSEWHIINENEWDDELEHEQAVMIGGASVMKRPADAKGPAMSVMSVAPHDGTDDSADAKPTVAAKAKGGSGWTKLRGRGGDAA